MEQQGDREKENQSQPIRAASAVLDDGRLAELIYDPVARRTAFAVWREGQWGIESEIVTNAERFIPFSPNNNLIRHDVLLLPSQPEEFGSEEQLFEEIRAYIHRYVDVSPMFEKIASAYVLLSWVYDAFNELPYLRVRGEYGSGKTRFLLTVGALCYRPFFASGASTVSPIFHIIDAFRGTLVIDEADFRFSDEKAEVIKIFNNGNARGMPVLRTMVSPNREFNPRAFQVFGPKLVATRGTYDDRALESRFITEDMGRHRLRSDIPISLPSQYLDEARQLRNKLLLYRFRTLREQRPTDLLASLGVEARLKQIFVPLMSVVRDNDLRRDIAAMVECYQGNAVAERGMDVEAQILEVLWDLWAEPSRTGVPVSDIANAFAERFGNDDRAVTPKWIGFMLRQRLRVATRKSHGVFIVPREERARLDVLWERYGISGSIDSKLERVNGAGAITG
jgi:hypothetical protein